MCFTVDIGGAGGVTRLDASSLAVHNALSSGWASVRARVSVCGVSEIVSERVRLRSSIVLF